MTFTRQRTRREVGGLIAASAALLAAPTVLRAQTTARVIVIGGGFGGASCARALRQADAKLEVTLVEANKTFTSCPQSNEVIAGLREISAQYFGYDKIAAEGVRVVLLAAAAIDAPAHKVTLVDGATLAYDRLVLAPGIDIDFTALQGYDEAASALMPHAYKAGEQTLLLRQQIEAMPDGGTVAIAVPANPSRCPPAPYERASLIAHYLKTYKPKSKVLILDAKDSFSQQKLFEQAWNELYAGMIERIPLSQGGRVTGVEIATRTVVTEFGNYNPDVANIIPPQKAGRIAALAAAADRTGWCPIDAATFASKLLPDVHVIGDACLGGGIPKSAGAAQAQGKACAAVVVRDLTGRSSEPPPLTGICYSLVAPNTAFSLSGVYQPKGDLFAEVEGGRTSSLDAPRSARAAEADAATAWFKALIYDAFG
ncbi:MULTISPECIES: NAD(P)/FAD-dependent oxidoreductase [Bradyrhizobium]|jgi:NADPH-dependent 2,4-dienoyl-CoA reductase/sulfur reductase-like enzyme|uniref:FAD-dependent oxidoreductase n=4 Tax=Bradyrhizobium TaxID=374 RepID=A0ABS5G6H9_9BRAD|nr:MULTISPECIES: NAD(P)/FAD-dependent oxidoreductase [Bradyrhizobium]MBR1136933.1 FAD-dependent oxidoreductase [Bradyrhizobium denitrificans]MDU1492538.1 NAD(P)/FAD-dependent oxidoreductase [Bradyrhizobium sp.]MDU1542927.1 NAD(P)/FAD-dependent oxidoreductase [Bradyrhizobium sp.]MDU1690733.1 NAD(P)/FAD-dependent oxidoreductase [Bradyrhizobium sp.]MDU1807782.1 NAD(P)/FAD-dependent oxidoreductase [Bradyrhizobium sp.]